ncbi:MAG TPA: lipoate--protein ligase family protein [Anaerolineales bacterium]|nr:lipoate--protein ligase family protein [Anaerolineales bacterium]
MTFPYPPTTWRLIQTPPAAGAWNMAVDEAILAATGRGEAPPTLRLYAWDPPCLSLGYAQPAADVDLPALQARGWHLVRRPTGGRAILHTDELTYSICGPLTEPRLAGSVIESYRILSAALLAALHRLGLPAQSQATPGPANPNGKGPVCFETPSNYEITAHGKKLVGSAQARRREGVLQHGSFPLTGDLQRITQVLVFADPAARSTAAERLLARATTAQAVLGRAPSWQEAAQAYIAAFEETLHLSLQPAELTPIELEEAARLADEKFAHPSWTERI